MNMRDSGLSMTEPGLSTSESDLVVLVPDKNMEATIAGLLSRPHALGIPQMQYRIYVHTWRDSGCLLDSHNFLRPLMNLHAHVLVLFDRHGCGQEGQSRESLEEIVESRLSDAGWNDRAAVIVLDPELEIWVWSNSPHVERCLGWEGKQPGLRAWLCSQGLWPDNSPKPSDPKKAVEQALCKAGKPRSSSLYEQMAKLVSFQRCTDQAFAKFKEVLQKWAS
ncbi:MAG: hypothetical protein AB1847_03955 [bacterium]